MKVMKTTLEEILKTQIKKNHRRHVVAKMEAHSLFHCLELVDNFIQRSENIPFPA